MDVLVLMAVFFILLFLGVPIAFSLCLSALFYMIGFSDVPLIIIGQQMLKGVDSFTLMAIPFFVIAGGLMESGGISKRIVNFARTIVGFVPGGLAVVTVVASMIFAAMTGAGAATTAAVGGIMIPSMEEEGYDGGYASAVQAVGGILATAYSSQHTYGALRSRFRRVRWRYAYGGINTGHIFRTYCYSRCNIPVHKERL